jgi:putative FmdB family regulatory protein
MPIYEYECEACGHRSEELQKMDDPPLTTCPACGGPYKKLLSAPAFQFKGSGWYVTDYARKDQQRGERSGEKEGGGEGAAKEGGGGAAKEGGGEGAAAKEGGGKKEGAAGEKAKKGGKRGTS